jgi:hypothetical protein
MVGALQMFSLFLGKDPDYKFKLVLSDLSNTLCFFAGIHEHHISSPK